MTIWTVRKRFLSRNSFGVFPACVAVGHKLYCFGGDVSKRDRLSVRVFDTESLSWTSLQATAGESPSDIPGRRFGHTVVLIGRTAYLWGGALQPHISSKCFKDLYAFDTDARGWSKPEASGSAPEGRIWHSACALGDVMYVHGGYVHSVCKLTNDIHTLNTGTMVWSAINARGPPAPRTSRHSATILGEKMFVFGGVGMGGGGKVLYHGIRVFDTTTNLWSEPSVQTPKNRWGHSAFAYDGELHIFGRIKKYQKPGTLELLWKFNPKTCNWEKVETMGTKGPRPSYPMRSFLVRDRVIVFADGGNGNIDLSVLDLNPSLRTLCKVAREHRRELAAMAADSESAEARGYAQTRTVFSGRKRVVE